jgi:hypothetical protein
VFILALSCGVLTTLFSSFQIATIASAHVLKHVSFEAACLSVLPEKRLVDEVAEINRICPTSSGKKAIRAYLTSQKQEHIFTGQHIAVPPEDSDSSDSSDEASRPPRKRVVYFSFDETPRKRSKISVMTISESALVKLSRKLMTHGFVRILQSSHTNVVLVWNAYDEKTGSIPLLHPPKSTKTKRKKNSTKESNTRDESK